MAKRGPSCRACGLSDGRALDAALVGGESFGKISIRFGLSKAAVFRHKQHVAETIDATAERPEDVDPLDVASVLRWTASEARRLGRLAEGAGDYGTALRAVVSVRDGLQWVKGLPPPSKSREDDISPQEGLSRARALVEAFEQKVGAAEQLLPRG